MIIYSDHDSLYLISVVHCKVYILTHVSTHDLIGRGHDLIGQQTRSRSQREVPLVFGTAFRVFAHTESGALQHTEPWRMSIQYRWRRSCMLRCPCPISGFRSRISFLVFCLYCFLQLSIVSYFGIHIFLWHIEEHFCFLIPNLKEVPQSIGLYLYMYR